MKKYSIYSKRAAKEVARYIDISVYNKRLSFLFGAGINYNIAEESLSWDDLASVSINNFLGDSPKKYNKFEKEAISRSLLSRLGNNKLAISFEPIKPKIEIHRKSDAENEWFITGFDQISQKMNGSVEIMTLNYDHVLSDVLHRKPVNFLSTESIDPTGEILHIHGMINKQKIVGDNAVLTMYDYVNNASIAEEKLTKFLLREDKEEKIKNETLIIIGSSLQEEHILRSFSRYKKRDQKRVNILLITHQPKDKYYLHKLNKIYDELGVKVVNINANEDYKNDFIDFWELLSNELQNPVYSPVAGGLTGREDIIDNDFYYKVKEFLKTKKDISLEEMFNELNIKNMNSSLLIRPIYWLEKTDGILKKGELKRYAFDFMVEIPIGSIYFFYDDIQTKDVARILEAIDKVVPGSSKYGNDPYDYDAKRFVIKYWGDISKLDLSDYKNIIRWISEKSNDEYEKFPIEISEFLENKYDLELLIGKNYNYFTEDKYPDKSSVVFKVVNKRIKNNEKMDFIVPESKEDVVALVKSKNYRQNKEQIFSMFLIKKYKKIITDNISYFVELIVHSGLDLNSDNDVNYTFYYMHVLLYVVLINDSVYKEDYLKVIKNEKNYPIKEFPRDIEIIGSSGFGVNQFSEYDGQSIFSEKIIFNDEGEIMKTLSKSYVSLNEKESIISYFRKDFSISKYEQALSIDKLKNWGIFEKNISRIYWKCKSWDEYYNFRRIFWEHNDAYHYYEFIVIEPPTEIHKRKQELVRILESKFNKEQYIELTDISRVSSLREYEGSSDLLWWVSELKILIKYREESNYAIDLLNNIFKKAFSWRKNTFIKVIEGEAAVDSFQKLQLAFLYQGDDFKIFSIKKIIELHRVTGSNIFDSLFDMVDWIIRSKDRSGWKDDYFIFKEYVNSLELTNQQKSTKKRWFKNIDKVLVFNYISHGIEFDFKSTGLALSDIFRVTSGISKLKNKKLDNRLLRILESVPRVSGNRHDDDLFFLRTFKYENLGEESNNFIFFEIKRRILSMKKGSRIYGKEFLDGYLEFLSTKKYNQLSKVIEDKDFRFVN